MSAPEPDWTAAVMRGWRSLALMVSSVTSAPRALEASGIWRLSSTSDSVMKSTNGTQWSLVPWTTAGARRAARMPSIPPAAAAASPAVWRKRRRPRDWDSAEASLLSWLKRIPLGWSDTRGVTVKCGEFLTKKPASVNGYPCRGTSHGRQGRRRRGPERHGHRHRHGADGARGQEEPRIGAEGIVEKAAAERAQPHPDARDEEHGAKRRAQRLLAEVLPGHQGIERHGGPVGDAEDEGQGRQRAEIADEEEGEHGEGLERQRHDEGRLGADTVGHDAGAHSSEDRRQPREPQQARRRHPRHALVDGVGDEMEDRPGVGRAAREMRQRDRPEGPAPKNHARPHPHRTRLRRMSAVGGERGPFRGPRCQNKPALPDRPTFKSAGRVPQQQCRRYHHEPCEVPQ